MLDYTGRCKTCTYFNGSEYCQKPKHRLFIDKFFSCEEWEEKV